MSLLDKKAVHSVVEASLDKDAKIHEQASTQIDLPAATAARVAEIREKLIPDEMLDGEGRVPVFHVTVKYGVREDESTLRQALANFAPFTVALGKTRAFVASKSSNDTAAPVVVEAHASELGAMHKAVADAMGSIPDEFPYVPHMTIAYVKPEEAQHFAGSDAFAGISFRATSVMMSRHDDNDQVEVPIGGGMARTAAAPAVAPEIPQVEPQTPQQDVVERDEPATEEPEEVPYEERYKQVPPKPDPKPKPERSEYPLPEESDVRVQEKTRPVTRTKAFKQWFGKSKAVDTKGRPLVVYHGTTHDIAEFDPNAGNPDNHYGKGMYFTDSKLDVAANYATNVGPDITARIETLTENIRQQMLDEGGMTDEDKANLDEVAEERARQELLGEHGGATMPVYLSIQNPVYVQKRGGTTFEYTFDEETEEEGGSAMRLYNAVMSEAPNYSVDGRKLWNDIVGNLGTEFDAYDFEQQVRKNDRIEDDEGNMSQGAFLQDVYAAAGFDGIIHSAWEEFGSKRQYGRPMMMDYDTRHYVVWDPSKVKSAIGNVGAFDPKQPDITASWDKAAAGADGTGDLVLANKVMNELFPVLGEAGLPRPTLRIVNQPRSRSLGQDVWRVGIQGGKPSWGDSTEIELQKSILNDEGTLRRVIAHELCHHADSLVNGVEKIKSVRDLWTYKSFMRDQRETSHGRGWRRYTQRFNAKYGADFVTEKSDETYVQEEQGLRPYNILMKRDYDGIIAYEVSSRLTTKAKKYLDRLAADKADTEHRITQTDDRDFMNGFLIGSWYWVHSKDPEAQEKLEELWGKAPKVMPAAQPITAAVPQLDPLEHGVSKDYDRVRWVYQQFYDNRIRSMPWRDFQKKFQWATNSPLFTEVRQNRPDITMEDLERWMEEYRAKAKEYQNYELEYGTYQDKATSFRDVEQLVLKVNQSASAAEIIGEDEMMRFFLEQVAHGSAKSGHPVGENTVGWLRVDFVSDQWLLVDEVQSDLINAVDLAKRFITEPTLETLMGSYRSEAVKQKIRDMGATEEMFQRSKQEFARRGYTVEKLDEMRQSLANLFKDWAEYGIASLIEIARRQGIRNIAIHTGQSVARRDPDLEAGKAGRYYDQIARAFGFKKQPLDIGDLKGEFWVRTASAKDAAAAPERMYHYTKEDFEEFDPMIGGPHGEFGTHLAPDPRQVENFGGEYEGFGGGGRKPPTGARVIPVKVNIKNPVRLEDRGTFNPNEVLNQLRRNKVVTKEEEEALVDLKKEFEVDPKALRDLLLSKGYDGIVYLNRREGVRPEIAEDDSMDDASDREFLEAYPEVAGNDSYIALRSDQIKSFFASKTAAFEGYYEGLSDQAASIIQEYEQHLGNDSYRQRWEVVPAGRLTKIWNDYAKAEMVRDEKGMDDIAWIVMKNIWKIHANTILCGHTEQRPTEFAEEVTGKNFEGHDIFEDYDNVFFEDDNGQWRISDYALRPLIDASLKLETAATAEQKLQAVDRILNIVHARSDLASWFVQGGTSTLNRLFKGESVTAGKRDQATTSMTLGVDSGRHPDFPQPVLIRWERGMRWRSVLKSVKAIANEVAGERVPWRDIYIWASLWEDYESQQEGWEEAKARGTRAMFDVLRNGSFVSVGKPCQPEAVAAGAEEPQPMDRQGSHKETPLSDTTFRDPEIGMETNAYADMPEKVRGDEEYPPLETLAPQLFEKEASVNWHSPQATVTLEQLEKDGYLDFVVLLQQYAEQEDAELDYARQIPVVAYPTQRLYEQVNKWKLDPGDERGRPTVDSLKLALQQGVGLPPVLLDGDEVLDGRHRTVAAYELGLKAVPAVQLQDTFISKAPAPFEKEGAEVAMDAYPEADAERTPEEIAAIREEVKDVEYTFEVLDSHRGELSAEVGAWLNDKPIGYVTFSELETGDTNDPSQYAEKEDESGGKYWEPVGPIPREVFVKYVYVHPRYRRVGIGTGMYEKIKKEFPGEKIVSGGTTDRGGKFRKSLTERGVIAGLEKRADTDILVETEHGNAYGDLLLADELPEWFDRYYISGYEKFVNRLQESHSLVATLEGMDVEPGARGIGHGKTVLTQFVEKADSMGADTVVAMIDTAQRQRSGFDLVEWYKRQGFKKVPTIGTFPVMALKITGQSKPKNALLRRATRVPIPSLEEVLEYGCGSVEGGIHELVLNWKPLREKVKDLPETEQEAVLDKLGLEEIARRWEQVKVLLQSHRFPLTVYRGVCANSMDEIVTDPNFVTKENMTGRGLGVYWAYDEDSAYLSEELVHNCPSWGKEGITLFRAVVSDPSKVDWLHTAYVNLAAADEKEVHLVKGAQIQVTGVKKYGEHEWSEPPEKFRTVTAAFAEGQNQVQHTDHRSYGMSKVLKSDPFGEEVELLHLSKGKDVPEANPQLSPDPARSFQPDRSLGKTSTTVAPTKPLLFMVEVPKARRKRFWVRPKGRLEFWAFEVRPRAFPNEKIVFTFDRRPVAEAVILKIEDPNKSCCSATGKYREHYKVFWSPRQFRRYGAKTAARQWIASDVRSPQRFDLWAVVDGHVEIRRNAPSRMTHADWFRELGIPDKGHFFDRTPRGDARRYLGKIRLRESSELDNVPQEVVAAFEREYPGEEVVAEWTWAARAGKIAARMPAKEADRIFSILAEARLDGVSGKCFPAAIAMNRVLFGGKGRLLAAFNKAFLAQGRLKGHVAVKFGGRLWDAEGETSMENLESWGMLDPEDQDYIEEYGEGWNDRLANEVVIKEIGEHITGGYDNLIPEYEKRLREALTKFTKTADKVLDVGEGDTYWAGEGNAASGVLPVCPSKGTVCLAWRSGDVMEGNCWGTIGGGVQKGMSPEESAKAEMAEETGYHGGVALVPAYVFADRGFKYFNFIGITPQEFSFSPGEGHGWETDHIAWSPYAEVLEDMEKNPGDYHPGLHKLFAASREEIEHALGIKPGKQATGGLGQYLESVRLTVIAPTVMEAWQSGTEREGEGMCEYISDSVLAEVLKSKPGLYGKVVHGEDHSWVVVADRKDAYRIDIPWAHYQTKDPGWSPGWPGWKQKTDFDTDVPENWAKLVEITPTERPWKQAAKESSTLDDLTEKHDAIKEMPGRLRTRDPHVGESVCEIQQERIARLADEVEKRLSKASKGHMTGVRRALADAEVAFHDYLNSRELDSAEKLEEALNLQETALMIVHQILRETERGGVKTAWQEIAYNDKDEKGEVSGDLLGGILESDGDLKAWAENEDFVDDRLFRVFMRMFKGKRVGVIDAMNAWEQGKGRGTEMLERFVAECRSKGCAAIVLEVGNAPNKFSLYAWYRRKGFEQFGAVGGLPIMVMWLNPSEQVPLFPEKSAAISPKDRVFYHGTNEEGDFTELRPGGSILWLAERPDAESYAHQHYRKGKSRIFKVVLKPNAKIIDLRDLSEPLVQQVKGNVDAWRKVRGYPPMTDEEFLKNYTDYGVLEGNIDNVKLLKNGGVDGVICNDVYSGSKYGKHVSLALINANAIASQKLLKTAEQQQLFPDSQQARFMQWFQGSKAVDKAGNPMPVYHGTRSSVDFEEFSTEGPPYEGEGTTSSGSGADPTAYMGAHFAEEAGVANQFAMGQGWQKSRYEGEAEKPRVIQVFLRITNPKDFGGEENLRNFIYQGKITDDEVLGMGCRSETEYNPWEGEDDPEIEKKIEEYFNKYENDQSFRADQNQFLLEHYRPMDMEEEYLRNAAYELAMQARHKLEQAGHDGVRYKNIVEGGHAWIAFAANQIKSAWSNFTPNDPRFTASKHASDIEMAQKLGLWFTETGAEKDADWKSRYVLPTALALGLGAPSMEPSMYKPPAISAPAVQEKQVALDELVEAIRRAEGANPDLHNPGNLVGFHSGEIMQFETDAQGVHALKNALHRIADGKNPAFTPDVTLEQAGKIYANGDPNWAKNVSQILGVDPQTSFIKLIKGKAKVASTHSDVMYHTTDSTNRFSVLKNGLLGSMSEAAQMGGYGVIFLDTKIDNHEGKYTDVWQVNVKGLELEPDDTTDISGRPEWTGHTWWAFYGDIPPSRLKLIRKGETAMASWAKKAAGFAFKSFQKLWHVGTMNPKDKRDDSYEGAGLSVSVNPEEWSMIAKLPGDLWEFTKPGNKFVNFHRLSKAQRAQIGKWGVSNGYVQPAELWRHSWFDDEISEEGEWRYSDYATKEEAEAELGGYGGEEKVEPVKGGMTATPKLSQKSKRGKIEPVEIMDLLVAAYAEDELDCDGVWWADILDPENLSAPRGVIFPSKLPSWDAKKVKSGATRKLVDASKWIYHPDFGAFKTRATAPHARFIEEAMGHPMSFGRNYDSVEKGYAFVSKDDRLVRLQTFGGPETFVPNDVFALYRREFPGYAIEETEPKAKSMYAAKTARLTRDNATWEGEPFTLGAVNLLDGQIEETHTFKEAEEKNWHHNFIFSTEILEKERADFDWKRNTTRNPEDTEGTKPSRRFQDDPGGSVSIFWVTDEGKIGCNQPLPADIEQKIMRQIKLQALKQAATKTYLYHGTYESNLPSIIEHGLGGVPSRSVYPQSGGGLVYLASDPEAARKWARDAQFSGKCEVCGAETKGFACTKECEAELARREQRPKEKIVVLRIDESKLDPAKLDFDKNIRIPEECPECATPVLDRSDPTYTCNGCAYEFEGDVSYQYAGVIPPSAVKIAKTAVEI